MYHVRITSFRTTLLGVCYYTLDVTDAVGGCSWKVERRFRDFALLDCTLRRQYPGIEFPIFPPKAILGILGGDELRFTRSMSLRSYVEGLLARVEAVPQSVIFRDFLGIKNPSGERFQSQQNAEAMREQGKIPEDTVCYILSFLDPQNVIYLGQISRTWHASSMSGSVWRRLRLQSMRFEAVQRTLLGLFAEPSISLNVREISLDVQFSRELAYNLQMSLPLDVRFTNLNRFRFSSLRPAATGSISTGYMCQELLETILAHSTSLDTLEVETELSVDLLRTIAGICALNPLEYLRIVLLNRDVSEEVFSNIVEAVSRVRKTVRVLEVLIHYSQEADVPDVIMASSYGERIGHYAAHARFMQVLRSCESLTRLSFDFMSRSAFLETDDPFPAKLQELELRFVENGLFAAALHGKSLWEHTHDSVPETLTLLRLSRIGPDSDWFGIPPLVHEGILPTKELHKLRILSVEGAGTGIEEFTIRSEFLQHCACLTELTLINCVSSVSESFVESILTNLSHLKVLQLQGPNERLSDTLLCNLGNPSSEMGRCIRNGRLKNNFKLPLTRYMSRIGLDAVLGLVEVVSAHRPVVTGRSARVVSDVPFVFSN